MDPLTQSISEPLVIVPMLAIVFAGAFVTSAFGVGGGILMTPLFLFLVPAKTGIAVLAPLSFLMAVAGVRQYWGQWNPVHIFVLLPASLAGIWLGSYLLAVISSSMVSKTVGLFAIAFGVTQLITATRPHWRERFRPTHWQGVCFGFGSGVSSALAHAGGIVFSFYLLPNSRTKESFVGTTLFLFFFSGLVKIGSYFYYGILNLPVLWLSLILIPILFIGSYAGRRLNAAFSPQLFVRGLSILVVLLGVRLLVW